MPHTLLYVQADLNMFTITLVLDLTTLTENIKIFALTVEPSYHSR